jgi:hypothetical protein
MILALLLIQPYQGSVPAEEASAVSEIVTVMAESNLLSLASKRKYLVRVGKKIEHLHPLDFLKVVVVSRPLLEHIRNIQKSSVKWRAFVSGISKGFEEAFSKGEFDKEMVSFCEVVKIAQTELIPLIQKKDWESFLKTVIRQVQLASSPQEIENEAIAKLPVNPKSANES